MARRPQQAGPCPMEQIMRVRTYKHHNDYSRITELAEQLHAESTYVDQPFSRDKVHEFLTEIDGNNTQMFVAENDAKAIVGFIVMTTFPYMFREGCLGHDLAFYVMREYRHTLAFAALLRAGEKWARDNGADKVLMGITAPHSPERASRAYTKMGYAQVGIVMRKDLLS